MLQKHFHQSHPSEDPTLNIISNVNHSIQTRAKFSNEVLEKTRKGSLPFIEALWAILSISRGLKPLYRPTRAINMRSYPALRHST
jgi:hypothetical protein